MSEFRTVLSQLLAESGKSVNQVAAFGGVDRAYLMRLLSGEKRNPSPETLLRIWMGLAMDPSVVAKYPTFTEGWQYLVQALAMSSATFRSAGEQ